MKLAIAGIDGRMGRAISELAEQQPEAGYQLLAMTADDDFAALAKADALIDFTRPDYAVRVAREAAKAGVPMVSGTTGFSEDEFATLNAAAQSIPLLWSSNLSVGVALVSKLVRDAAAALPQSYDIEVLEMHHRDKVDAPSGTALALGKAAAQGRGVDFDTHKTLSREGIVGARQAGSIGFATLRGGRVIGDHSVIFAGEHDIIEITHRSHSRAIYAQGALHAAQWLQGKQAGLYSMDDMLAGD